MSGRPSLRSVVLLAPLLILPSACGRDGVDPRTAYRPPEELDLCLAVRGNGERMFSSLYSLARVSELFGPLDAIAGSSSGSAVAFLYESLLLNPAIRDCGEVPCDPREQGRRLSLGLKSIQGLLAARARSNQVRALVGLGAWLGQVRDRGFGPGELGNAAVAAARLLFLVASPDVRGLVNPAVTADLLVPWRTGRTLAEVRRAVSVDAFGAEDSSVLFRRSLLSMEQVVDFLGRTGNLVAGRRGAGPDAWRSYFEACSGPAVGRTWAEFADAPLPGGDGTSSCRSLFEAILPGPLQRAVLRALPGGRLSEPVGGAMPVLVGTSALVGETARQVLAAAEAFEEGVEPAFRPGFEDVRAGYWGPEERVGPLVEVLPTRFPDRKSRMALALGSASWERAMEHSMTEPGLGPVLDYGDRRSGVATAGGWLDNHAVMALRAAGCRRVLYLTRRGADSDFAQAIAGFLGAGDRERRELFDVEAPESSMSLALREADGVWCTDWNAHGLRELPTLIEDGYHAPLQVNDPGLLAEAGAYPGASRATGHAGCEPGAPLVPETTPAQDGPL